MRRHLLTFALTLLSVLQLSAYENFNFHVLDVRSGISNNYIQDILHDQYGFMWFATRMGLNRYDGYLFKTYTITQLGAYDNDIEWVAEDGKGNIWMKSPVIYCYYDREKDELSNKIEDKLAELNINDAVTQLFIDHDRNLWCVANHRLYCYQFYNEQLHQFDLPQDSEVIDLDCRDSRAYLLLSGGKVATINWMNHTLQHEIDVEALTGFKSHIYVDSNYSLWFYATHGLGISCYSPIQKRWVDFPGKKELNAEHNNITAVTDDGKGNIWIGTDNKGIYISQLNEKKFTSLDKKSKQLFTLPSNHITCFFKDDKEIMWVGTSKQGVAYSCLNEIIFENQVCAKQEDVSSMIEDNAGNLWLGFDGEGIACYNNGVEQKRYYKAADNTLPSNLIVCSYLDAQNRIWWGSFGDGPFYYSEGKFIKPIYKKEANLDDPNYVRRITGDAYGNLWLGTYRQGLYRLDSDNNLVAFTMDNSELITNYIADLTCKDGQNLYVATSSGFFHLDVLTHKITHLKYDKDGRSIAMDDFVNCLFQDSRGLIWIGGRTGVVIYNPNENRAEMLTEADGLSHSYIRAIAEDANNNVWISTDHGITHVIVDNKRLGQGLAYHCYPYFEKDGLGNFTFNNFSMMRNKNNEVLIGGLGGYVKVRPVFNDKGSLITKTMFTGLHLANQRIEAGMKLADGRVILSKNIQLTDEITLKYSDANFSIDVSAMDYGSLHKLQYEYRLNNKEEWIKLDGNRLNFNKLTPGYYQLEVKATGHPSLSDVAPARLTIFVRPPFWQSTLAYLCYFLFFVTCVLLYVCYLRKKHNVLLQKQKHELEIAKLHEMDDAKMKFFTNVSHDLRTPLSMIITPLERMIDKPERTNTKEDLELMHRNALILLDEVNQLLDFRKLDKNETKLHTSYGNIVDFIKEVCQSFTLLCRNSNLAFNLQVNTPIIEMKFDRNKLQRILLNLISNAIKYNKAGGSITVKVDRILSNEGEQVRIQIADTGIGIREENKSRIFERFFQESDAASTYTGNGIGLHIVKEYITLHGGTIEVTDNEPEGTVFTLYVPIEGATDALSISNHVQSDEEGSDETQKEEESGKPSLLVVEDNTDFRNFIINCLQEEYQVYSAENGKAALQVLTQHNIDIVISDVMMPVMDGLELCQKIKTDIRHSHIPVILLTARTAQEHVLDGLREGADDYLTKPFNLEILKLRIAKLMTWTKNNHEKFKQIEVSPSEITVSSIDEQLIEKAIQAVEENMDNSEFSVEDLSAEVGMSRGHLYKKLISITGKSPLEFIRILRVKRGKQLLEQSQMSISQISYQVGLSPKQFSKYYKEEYGHLPSELKKQL